MTALTALLVGALLSCAFTTTAAAKVELVEGQSYGVEPHATVLEHATYFDPFTLLQYNGGPIMSTTATYAIYWDPASLRVGDPGAPGKYQGDWQGLINQFLHDVGANSEGLGNVFALTPQYPQTNGTRPAYNSVFRGGGVDHDTYPADGCTDPEPALNQNFACLTATQLREELKTYIAANKLPVGMGTIFYLLTPPGVTVCTDVGGATGHCSDSTKEKPFKEEAVSPSAQEISEEESYKRSFCSYHGFTQNAASETILYAVIPWTAGTIGSALVPANRNGSDCQDGSGVIQEPNQDGLSPEGTYDHALPDILINEIAAEQMDITTDPLFSSWTEPLSGNEVSDQCRLWFEAPPVVQGSGSPDEHTGAGHFTNQTINGHSYYLNTEYNQAANYYEYPGLRCELHNNLVPSFTAPNTVNVGDVVAFDGAESDVTMEQSADPTPEGQPQYRATFSWNFGDGSPVVSGPGFNGPTGNTPLYASVFHSYTYGGTYQVTLTVTDAGGTSATYSQQIAVNGPPPPSTGGGSGGGGGSEGSTTNTNTGTSTGSTPTLVSPPGSGGPGGGTPGIPSPVARAAASSHSLPQALRNGLLVSYSVNEQVAGSFQVLLATKMAHSLHVQGRSAMGLPPGSEPALVIGQAILVTTKGGQSSVRIKFSKQASTRLRHVHKLTLTLRLIVRNASQSPQSTTVLSTFVLHR
jgi:PKD domain